MYDELIFEKFCKIEHFYFFFFLFAQSDSFIIYVLAVFKNFNPFTLFLFQ